MSKKLNNKDFIEEGFGKPLIDFFKLLDEHIDKSTANIKELAGVLKKDISNNKLSTGADVQKLNEQKEQANALKRIQTEQKQAQKELSKIAEIESKKQAKIEQDRRREIGKTVSFEKRERLKLANDLIKQRQKDEASRKRFSEKLRAEEEKQLARKKKLINKNKAEQGSLKQLRQQLSLTTKAYDQLSKEERENTQVGKVLVKQIQKQQSEIRKLEEATGRAQRNVGNYKSAWSGVSNLFRSGMGILGVAGGISLLSSAVRKGFSSIVDFDKELSVMAGISGLTRGELKGVREEILKVAGGSVRTSNDVAKLATTLFSLGKTKEEVNLLLTPINNLSIALGSTAEETANLLGGTLNAFGKGAESGQEFADVIANIRSSTALDFQGISESLGFIAPTAKAVGLTIGETGALIGTLKDANIKASRAGRLLSSSFARLIGKGLDLNTALETIRNSQDKVAVSSELFGKEAFTLGLILADNEEKVATLTNEFDNLSKGSLKKLVDEQLKSASAQLNILGSNFETILINVSENTGALDKFTNGIKFLSKNLGTILKLLLVAVSSFVAFKTVIIATNIGLALFNKQNGILSVRLPRLTGSIKTMRKSFSALNTTMKANIIGLVASAVTVLIGLFYSLSDSTDEATESQKELNKAQEDNLKGIERRFGIIRKLSKESLTGLKSDIEERIRLEKELSELQAAINKESFENLKKTTDFELETLKVKQNLTEEERQRLEFLKQFTVSSKAGIITEVKATEQQIKLEFQLKKVNEELRKRKDLQGSEGGEIEKKGLLEQIDEKIKQARAKQRATESKDEITKQQIKIKELEEERRILLDIGEIKKQTAKQAEKDDKKEDERREKRGKENLKALEEEVKSNEDAEKEKRKFQDETIAKAFEAGEKLLNRLNDITNKNLDARIEASSKNQDRLTTLAASGNKEASKSLAQEADNQRNLEQERARTIRRQTAQAVILAGLELTIAAARRGDEQPAQTASNQLSSNISNSESLAGNISNLAGFFTGTEKVSQDLAENKFYDGKDGYAVRVHGTERIIQGNDNQKLEGLSNAELVNAGVLYKKGGFDYHKYAGEVQSVNNVMINDNKEVVNELKDLKKAFINNQKSIDFSIDPINKHLIKETKEQGRKLRKHYKNGRLF